MIITDIDLDGVPFVKAFKVVNCHPHCPCQNVHLVLGDENLLTIATATLTIEQAKTLIVDLHQAINKAEQNAMTAGSV